MMPIEQQVSSIEPSKRLKALGVKQESAFYWVEAGQKYGDGYGNTAGGFTQEMLVCVAPLQGIKREGRRSSSQEKDYKGDIKFDAVGVGQYGDDNYIEYPILCAAFTASESFEELPEIIEHGGHKYVLVIGKHEVSYRNKEAEPEAISMMGGTFADRLASMRIYLIEKGIIKACAARI